MSSCGCGELALAHGSVRSRPCCSTRYFSRVSNNTTRFRDSGFRLRLSTTPQRAEDDDTFAASERWLCAFMRRYGLSLGCTTNLTTLTDVELVRRAARFMSYLSKLKSRFDLSRIILMDETTVYFEDPRRETVDFVGSRHLVLRSTGFASMRVAAVLAVAANGTKLLPLVICKKRTTGTTGISSSVFEKLDGVYVVTQMRAGLTARCFNGGYISYFRCVWITCRARHLFGTGCVRHLEGSQGEMCSQGD